MISVSKVRKPQQLSIILQAPPSGISREAPPCTSEARASSGFASPTPKSASVSTTGPVNCANLGLSRPMGRYWAFQLPSTSQFLAILDHTIHTIGKPSKNHLNWSFLSGNSLDAVLLQELGEKPRRKNKNFPWSFLCSCLFVFYVFFAFDWLVLDIFPAFPCHKVRCSRTSKKASP